MTHVSYRNTEGGIGHAAVCRRHKEGDRGQPHTQKALSTLMYSLALLLLGRLGGAGCLRGTRVGRGGRAQGALALVLNDLLSGLVDLGGKDLDRWGGHCGMNVLIAIGRAETSCQLVVTGEVGGRA